jgi:hypothetical protein
MEYATPGLLAGKSHGAKPWIFISHAWSSVFFYGASRITGIKQRHLTLRSIDPPPLLHLTKTIATPRSRSCASSQVRWLSSWCPIHSPSETSPDACLSKKQSSSEPPRCQPCLHLSRAVELLSRSKQLYRNISRSRPLRMV